MKKVYLCIFSLLCVFISSCSDENDLIDQKSIITQNANNAFQSKSEYYSHEFFQIARECINDVSFREFIKKESLLEFDGDYDILFATALNKEVPSSSLLKSSSNVLFKDYFLSKTTLKTRSSENSSLIDSILYYCPKLQISLPELFDGSTSQWDPINGQVLICELPTDYDDQKIQTIKAWDIKGNEYTLSTGEIPNIPVIVIGKSERIEISNDGVQNFNSKLPFYKGQYYNYRFADFESVTPETVKSAATLRSIAACDRETYSGYDILYKGKFVSIDAYRQVEGWPQGRPEFHVTISYSEKVGTTVTPKTLKKIISRDGWVNNYVLFSKLATKTMNIPTINWNKDVHGLYMSYNWIEFDDGPDQVVSNDTYTNKYTDGSTYTISTSTTKTNDDDEAGSAIIGFVDPTSDAVGRFYNTGILTFSIIQTAAIQ